MNDQSLRLTTDAGDDAGPNIPGMRAALADAIANSADLTRRQQDADNTRLCWWPGQQADARKPDTIDGRPASPWPGASDTRVPLADAIIGDQLALMRAAERRARLTVRGTESADMRAAGKTQIYLDHLRYTRIAQNVVEETEFAANWRQTHGAALMAITWHQEFARDHERVTLAQLAQIAQAQPGHPVAQLLAALHEPDREVRTALAAQLTALYPDLDRGEAHRQLQQLRTTGEMLLPIRRLRLNEPRWEALKLGRDVIVPPNTDRIDTARFIAWRWVGTRPQVEEKAHSEAWPQDFIDEVLKTEGHTVLDEAPTARATSSTTSTEEEMAGLYEVFYLYHTVTDRHGLPQKRRTVISPHIPARQGEEALHGPDEPLGYAHGQFPFVLLRRERIDRALASGSLGVPEIAGPAQASIKYLRDARIDATDLRLRPPTIRPEREIGLPLQIRPRGEIGERRASTTRPYPVPPDTQASLPLETDGAAELRGYFGQDRARDPVRTALREQDLADSWCADLAACWRLTLATAQQFETEATFQRIVGGRPVPMRISRDDIAGQYDLQLVFNTDITDPERMKAKIEVVAKLISPLDKYGIINFVPFIRGALAAYFPEFADEMIQTEEQAGEGEIKDEQNNWALMMAGERPMMREDGQNFALRLQWLERKTQEPGAQMRLASLPDAKGLVEERLQHLRFIAEQHTVNAQAGRVGVKEEAA